MAADNFVDNNLLRGVTQDLGEELFHFRESQAMAIWFVLQDPR